MPSSQSQPIASLPAAGYQAVMSGTKFHLVFGIDDNVEMYIVIDGQMRKTQINLGEAPFAAAALQSPDIKDCLEAWMAAARAPVWMSWADLEDALHSRGIPVDDLIERFPPRFIQNLL